MLPSEQSVLCKTFEWNTYTHLEATDVHVKQTLLYCLSIYLRVCETVKILAGFLQCNGGKLEEVSRTG